MHELEEAAFRQVGLEYRPQWGPRQLASVVADAWAGEQARLMDHDWIVHCAIQNQLWVWRPDAQGTTISVDDDPTLQNYPRQPPSKGIVAKWAEYRAIRSPLRHGQAPEPPDFDDLNMEFLHIEEEPQEPGQDDAIIDQRLSELELSPQQIQLFNSHEANLRLQVPDWRMPSAKATAKRANDKKH